MARECSRRELKLYSNFYPVEFMNDKKFVLSVSDRNSGLFYASARLKQDREFVWKVIQQNGSQIANASVALRNDEELLRIAIHQHIGVLGLVDNDFTKQLGKDKEFMLKAVQQNGLALCASIFPEFEHLKSFDYSEKPVMMKIVQEFGFLFEFASNDLKNDREMVLRAVQCHGFALKFASFELRNDKQVVLTAVTHDGRAFQYSSNELRNDKEIVLLAVSRSGQNLEYASYELKNDREVVLTAIKQDGLAIEYAHHSMKSDREIILEAIK